MKSKLKNILVLSLFSWLSACNSFSSESADHNHSKDAEQTEQEMEDAHHDDEVGLTILQMEKIGLELGGFEQKNLKSTLKVNGQLELPPQNKAAVSAITAGKITRILVKPGQRINKGGVLAYLQNPDFIQWQQDFLETEGQLIYLNKEWERQKDLVGKEIAPQKKLDKITAERAIAQATLKGVQAKLQLVGIRPTSDEFVSTIAIRSPINGYVRAIHTNTGIFANPEQALFEIVDNHHLHIDLKVFEKDLPYVKENQQIQFSLQSQPDKVMNAYIFAIGKALDETQRTVDVHAEIKEEKSELLPGMFVEARIITDNQTLATLPNEAITIDKGLKYIFVREEVHEAETHFKKVAVLTGASDFGYTEVKPLEVLPTDAKIVTKGAYYLMAQSKKGEEGAGHHH